MSDEKIASHIFTRWAAELRDKDRSWDNVRTNFEDLFFDLHKADVPFNEANEFLKPAIIKHFPSLSTAKRTWNKHRHSEQNEGVSFQEWLDEWKRNIDDMGVQAFHSIYSLPSDASEEVKKQENLYGSMSAKEYRLQRRYAESFPELDTDILEKRLAAGIDNYEEFFKDLDQILEKKNGDSENK